MPHYKDTQNNLHWLDSSDDEYLLPTGSVAITEIEVAALRPAYIPTYAEKRAAEYPPITDYLDGVVKGDQAQINKYITDCQAVKVKYPKANV